MGSTLVAWHLLLVHDPFIASVLLLNFPHLTPSTLPSPRSMVLHIVMAHYRERVELMTGLLGEILQNPIMGAMQTHVFVMSKAEDQVGGEADGTPAFADL